MFLSAASSSPKYQFFLTYRFSVSTEEIKEIKEKKQLHCSSSRDYGRHERKSKAKQNLKSTTTTTTKNCYIAAFLHLAFGISILIYLVGHWLHLRQIMNC